MTRIRRVSTRALAAGVTGCAISLIAFGLSPGSTSDDDNDRVAERLVSDNARRMIEQGRQTFRYDTFGDQAFWGAQLKLHQAIAGAKYGGVGPGVSPNTALAVGLKVDVDALPDSLRNQLANGKVNLNDPAATLALLKLNAVLGVTGFFNENGNIKSMGIQCALCHSTVDNSFAKGIGHRLDGWANRDLNVGAIIALAPDLSGPAHLLAVDQATVRTVLNTWGPGKFDAELFLDGKPFQPNGKPAAVLIPPAFGLAGVNLGTWTGFGSTTYWNALVSNLEMHGNGTFYDPRLNDPVQYPVAVKAGSNDVRNDPDLITSKLAALHFYQLAIPAPRPPEPRSYNVAAVRGKELFEGRAQCGRCHVPPLFTEPGYNMHTPEEIGIDDFQASRSPTKMYRTAPLKGLFTHEKGGFYHDGRFATLKAVVDHYDDLFKTSLSEDEKRDLIAYLRTL
jgi:hypothetical protein